MFEACGHMPAADLAPLPGERPGAHGVGSAEGRLTVESTLPCARDGSLPVIFAEVVECSWLMCE